MNSSLSQRYSVAVVGAGPAGLMAAEVIATAGHPVTVYERMPSPARKFLMAGRGGLNLTHSEPLDSFLTHYGGDAAAVQQAIKEFPPSALVAWAEALGQQTFKGSSGRIFPKAMKASPLLRAWLRRLDALGVEMKVHHTWTGFDADCGLALTDPMGQELKLKPDAVVLALGGASWPRLGSDGAWVAQFEAAGISVAPLEAANSGVLVRWTDVFATRFAGSPLKRIAVTIAGVTRRGEAIATRTGLEGGAIYALGPLIRTALQRDGSAALRLDLKADVSAADLVARLSKPPGSQSRSNFLRKATGLDAAAIGLLREAGPLPATAEAMAARIKNLPIVVHGVAGLERAISTAGGVQSSGLTSHFMLTNRPGMFVAGEMLDWEAPTGGYLLQASFATGKVAGEAALRWLAGDRGR